MNPFQHSALARKGAFCNRKKELREIRRSMENGDRAFIYSERRLGKTSLVKLALSGLPKEEFLGAYIDLWPTDDEESFIIAMARGISESLESKADKMLKSARQFFGAMAPSVTMDSDGKPTVTFAQRTASPGHPELRSILATPAIIAKKRKRRVVIVFDEFQRILEYDNDLVERTLRSVIQEQSEIAYIFLGSRRHLIRSMFLDQNRPLYRAGTHYPLGPIATEHWIPYIRSRFRKTDREIASAVIKELCAMTDGHPFYTQHLCHVLWEMSDPGTVISADNLQAALGLVLERESYAYTVLWESLGTNQQRFVTGLAHEPPGTQVYSADFIARYRLRSPASAQRVVQTLLERDVIDHAEGSFVLTDRIFGAWVRQSALLP
ncbi:MAG: ATP-binding protein [Candidatus Eisenbacteria bacterium]|uniref:ATP-binding protein n=1 Tax=Eiseniibacteriota bacterium TaxID=2212470 RepID=A0A948RTK8_UNCEI|nr:ATP-binding protein [Candidatus Eisenbacteria bacterium]MBU1950463.1 ATP-binding protein [Candidatus Eisenbacteria bacterium]MBU2690768.1 ATP-binding protein [Candidatus Eisenbacteria bacterium]